MRKALLLLGLTAGSAAHAQHIDIGIGGGGGLSFTHVAAKASGSAHAEPTPLLGLHVSYTFSGERLRLSSGYYRGGLGESVLVDVPNEPQNQEFTLLKYSWQVPLRLHIAVLPPTRRLMVNAVAGTTWQRFGKEFIRY